MRRLLVTMTFGGVLLTAWAQDPRGGPPPAAGPATQPSASAATRPSSLRTPAQVEILRNLLREREQARPLMPQRQEPPPGAITPPAAPTVGPDGKALLAEGTFLIERPARYQREGGRPTVALTVAGADGSTRTFELLPNQLLEALEREAQRGVTEFVISAQVTLYEGRNYLMLQKVLRRVSHGNLGP